MMELFSRFIGIFFQSPPHRGSSRESRARFFKRCAIYPFSPLLIGEVHAKVSVSLSPRARPRLSVPSSSGKFTRTLRVALLNPLAEFFQSPPHRGSSRE